MELPNVGSQGEDPPNGSENMPSSLGDIHGRAAKVVLGGLAAQLGLGCVYLASPLGPAMLAEFGWSRAEFMAAGSPRTIVIALASPLVGMLTARYGSRPVMAVSVALIGVVFAGYSAVEELWQLFALSIAIGLVVAGVGDIAVGTVVSKWVVRGRGLALGVCYAGSNFGGLIVSLLGAWILSFATWRDAYLWVGIGAVALLLPPVLVFVREPPPDTTDDAASDPDTESPTDAHGIDISQALRTRDFWTLAIALFLFYFYYIGVNAHLVLYLTDLQIPISQASLSFGITVFLGVGAKVGIGLVADRWPAKGALLINFAVILAASLLLLGIPAAGFLPVFIVAHGLATAAQNVVYPMIVAQRFGTPHMAKIYGVLMLALLPGGILGPIFAGWIFDRAESYTLAFQTFAALNAVGFLGLCTLRNRSA